VISFFISDIPNEPDESFDYYSSKGIYSAKELSQRPEMDSPKSTHTRIPSANINISIREQDDNGPETVTRTNRLGYADILINDPTQIDTANTEDNGTDTNTNENNGPNTNTNENNGTNKNIKELVDAEDYAKPNKPNSHADSAYEGSGVSSALYNSHLETVKEDD